MTQKLLLSCLLGVVLLFNVLNVTFGAFETLGGCNITESDGITIRRKLYLVETSKTVNHTDAIEICTNSGMELVSISGQAELDCLTKLLSPNSLYWTTGVLDLLWSGNATQITTPYDNPSGMIPWHKVCLRIGTDYLRFFECIATEYFPLCEILRANS